MIIAIDGPAGAGKSTIAKLLAARLGFEFLDTGAMYRSVALAAIRASIAGSESEALIRIAQEINLSQRSGQIYLDDEDVSIAIRAPEVTDYVRFIANHSEIRAMLVEQQREIGANFDLVTEGRDQATVVFPDAELKVFLTASPETRAKRRAQELAKQGNDVSFDQLLAQQNRRDAEDENRPVGGLKQTDQAYLIATDNLNLTDVVDKLVRLLQQLHPDRQFH